MRGEPRPVDVVRAAIECSVHVRPSDWGLTVDELVEVGRAFNFREGEMTDAAKKASIAARGGKRRLEGHELHNDFLWHRDPDFRNVAAFDLIRGHLRDLARSLGEERARVSREALLALAASEGVPELDVEAALVIMLGGGDVEERDGQINESSLRRGYPLASEQLAECDHENPPEPWRSRVMTIVRDVLARSTDGRLPSAEPAVAMEHALERLGYGHLRKWWRQTLDELRLSNEHIGALTRCVLSAALVEAALVFCVRHAQTLGLGTMASKTFTSEPMTRWSLDDLAKSAAGGGRDAILDEPTRDRVLRLFRHRQRIHAGRLAHEHPSGPVPDLRPEEGREARETVDIVLRQVLDWLARHPSRTA